MSAVQHLSLRDAGMPSRLPTKFRSFKDIEIRRNGSNIRLNITCSVIVSS
jgi:hypothetical protein